MFTGSLLALMVHFHCSSYCKQMIPVWKYLSCCEVVKTFGVHQNVSHNIIDTQKLIDFRYKTFRNKQTNWNLRNHNLELRWQSLIYSGQIMWW